MAENSTKHRPGEVRDAILDVMRESRAPLSVKEIEEGVSQALGSASSSSVRSYLRLNTDDLFVRETRGIYRLRTDWDPEVQPTLFPSEDQRAPFHFGGTSLYHANCFAKLRELPDESIHAVVTDPPYGLHEYTTKEQAKLRKGEGGVWRLPPSFDGHTRSPLPRFTTLTGEQLAELRRFFVSWGRILRPKLVPGANVVVASNPLLSHIVSSALAESGLERRGEIIRLVMTMRGGDRPKGAHCEFDGVSVMPRSMWEPWVLFRRPLEGRVQDNLRRWGTGGFRRPSEDRPFGDVIRSAPTRKNERALAPHPSLKPQAFMRELVRGVLPLGQGVVVDPFAGAGSTLAAAEAVGYSSVGIEMDPHYFDMACDAVPALAKLSLPAQG